jgi:DNA-binding MarR family transcriptional regulator
VIDGGCSCVVSLGVKVERPASFRGPLRSLAPGALEDLLELLSAQPIAVGLAQGQDDDGASLAARPAAATLLLWFGVDELAGFHSCRSILGGWRLNSGPHPGGPAYGDNVALPDDVYVRLLMLRSRLRRFERWSAEQANSAGLTPTQHQLLLAIRGHPDRRGPTIGEVADYLLLRQHSASELVKRAEVAGLVCRTRDDNDRRVTRLQLTDEGIARLESLTARHLEELERLALQLPEA